MKLNTRMLGEIEVNGEELLQFPQGLPGFEELRSFVLLKTDDDIPFHFLQSVEEEEVSFILTNPFWFYKEYEFHLPSGAKEVLQLTDATDQTGAHDLAIWSIVTIRGTLEEATINLQAPVLINTNGRVGLQVILHDTAYHPRHPLIQAESILSEAGEGGR